MQPKSFAVTIIATFISVFILVSCQRTVPVTIVGKWTLQTATGSYKDPTGYAHKDTTRYTSADYFEFKSDSTLNILVTGQSHNGRWKMLNNKLVISGTNYIDYPAGFDLPTLTATDLQLYYTETTTSTFLEQKLFFTR